MTSNELRPKKRLTQRLSHTRPEVPKHQPQAPAPKRRPPPGGPAADEAPSGRSARRSSAQAATAGHHAAAGAPPESDPSNPTSSNCSPREPCLDRALHRQPLEPAHRHGMSAAGHTHREELAVDILVTPCAPGSRLSSIIPPFATRQQKATETSFIVPASPFLFPTYSPLALSGCQVSPVEITRA